MERETSKDREIGIERPRERLSERKREIQGYRDR